RRKTSLASLRIRVKEHVDKADPHRPRHLAKRQPAVLKTPAHKALVPLPAAAAYITKRVVHPLGQIDPPVGLDKLKVVKVEDRPCRGVDLKAVVPQNLPAKVEQDPDITPVRSRVDRRPLLALRKQSLRLLDQPLVRRLGHD